MAAPKSPRDGTPVEFRGRGVRFGLFPSASAIDGLTLVSDPWAYLSSYVRGAREIPKPLEEWIIAAVQQSRAFHLDSVDAQLPSRPLLQYYALLNLVKAWVALTTHGPVGVAHHGLQEQNSNFTKTRLRLSKQELRTKGRAQSFLHVFRRVVDLCDGTLPRHPETIGMLDILGQIVGVHRTYATVTRTKERFCRLVDPEFRVSCAPRGAYLHFYVSHRDCRDCTAQELLRRCGLAASIEHVATDPDHSECYAFQSNDLVGFDRLRAERLDEVILPVRPYLHAVLTRDGYRYYLHDPSATSRPLPQLAALYAAFFYFGSVTRYHPVDFDKLCQKKDGWLIEELMATQARQFAYLCVSRMVRRDICLPFCNV